jgi:rhamnogalacturonan endolyase
MGWAIETGTWYSPYVVYDCDADGKAEVYLKFGEGDLRGADGRVFAGPEYLARLNGMTGELERKTPWHDRTGYGGNDGGYNRSNRNFLAIAYLDGQTPSIIMQRGTYGLIKLAALNANLDRIWDWTSSQESGKYAGQGSHGFVAADVDGDGRDELVYGAACVDDDGQGLWTLGMGHPDVCYVGEVDPARSGLEVFYGFETRQKKNGVCLVDAQTGALIRGYDGATTHVHNQGMCADILPDRPGLECFAGEKDRSAHWFYDAGGVLISDEAFGGLSPRAARWDADLQREIMVEIQKSSSGARRYVLLGTGFRYSGNNAISVIEGRPIAIADCLGDWREEIITTVEGELRIYSTTVLSEDRRVCLMQDRLYRNYVAVQSMGYWYPPLMSFYERPRCDFDGDGVVGFSDFIVFAQHFGAEETDVGDHALCDVNGDERVDFSYFIQFARAYAR